MHNEQSFTRRASSRLRRALPLLVALTMAAQPAAAEEPVGQQKAAPAAAAQAVPSAPATGMSTQAPATPAAEAVSASSPASPTSNAGEAEASPAAAVAGTTPATTKPDAATAATPVAAPPAASDPVIAAVLTRLGAAPASETPVDSGPSDSMGPVLDDEAGAAPDDFDAAKHDEKPMMSEAEALAAFYRAPDRKPLWVGNDGFNAKAKAALAEFAAAASYGLRPGDFTVSSPVLAGEGDRMQALGAAELALSSAALKYARYAKGGRIDPRKLSAYHERGPRTPDYLKLLGDLAASDQPGAALRAENPRHPQFEALREQLSGLDKDGGIADPASRDKEKKRLLILMNMERWRWMPDRMQGDNNIYVWANVPELHVRVVKDGKEVFFEKAIVGLQNKQTPMFSDEMEWIEFNPTWYVPDSIKVADVLPDLKRSGRMAARYHLKVDCGKYGNDYSKIDWSKVNIRRCAVTQPAGPKSVLGNFKFKFPNRFSVYMHDTLNRKLFNQPTRILSHGCVRVDDPRRMAEILLANDKRMSAGQIGSLLASGRQHSEHLRRKIPVHITYFSARVDDSGQLQTYPDYYGYDHRLAKAMFGRGDLFPVRAYVGSQSSGRPRIPRPRRVENPLPQFLR